MTRNHEFITYKDRALHLCKMGPDFLASFLEGLDRAYLEQTEQIRAENDALREKVDILEYEKEQAKR